MFKITEKITIPYDEIRFITSRSSGPGGQHVNTTDSRVTLLFDIEKSNSLNETQKATLRDRLRNRINASGVLQVSSQKFRSQISNKDAVIGRFIELLQWALTPVIPRKDTAVPKRAKRKRLTLKKRTGDRKRDRKLPDFSGEY